MKFSSMLLFAVIFCQCLSAPKASACTRILWNDNKMSVFSARTMDWASTTEPLIIALPSGIKRHGGKIGQEILVKENPLEWTSKYGSLVTGVYNIGAADGFNEKGFAAHMLYLNATDFGPRDITKPGLHAGLWAKYVIDNAASVKEAIELLKNVQVVMAETNGHKASVHLALEDESGDSAIGEYVKGKLVVHHGREFTIMTNDPSYDKQLALLKSKDFSKPSSSVILPGNVSPQDRFQRATYFLKILPEPKSSHEAIAGVLAIARNASVPFGAPHKSHGIFYTEYRTAMDFKMKTYYYELTTSPNVIWVDLKKFNLKSGASARFLNPYDIQLTGDVSGKFKKMKSVPF
jgi:penicillin V acylase-like amidase (Ntn superfamily)